MSLIILGVDPGSRATGYGLVAADGDQVFHLDSGFIALPSNCPTASAWPKFTSAWRT